jgi:hypothetical protein
MLSARRSFCALTCVLLLAGCQTTVSFTSDVPGAVVTGASGQVYGETPAEINFDDDTLNASRNPVDRCARIPGVTYTWKSGAQASTPTPIVLCGDSRVFQVHLDRPKQAPGVETDLRYALELQQRREAQLRHELEMERLYNDSMWPGMFWGPAMMPPAHHHHHHHRPPRRH